MLPGVLPLTSVRLSYRGFLLTYAPPGDVFPTNSFVAGVKSVCGVNTIGLILWSILGLIVGTTTGMVQLLNIFVRDSR